MYLGVGDGGEVDRNVFHTPTLLVVYHAASTAPSASDHASSLSPVGRRSTHLCVRLGEALGHAPCFPTVFETMNGNEAEGKSGNHRLIGFKSKTQDNKSSRQ